MLSRLERAYEPLWGGSKSAAPRPRSGPAPCGVPDKNIPQGSRSRAARWVLRSKPLPLAGRTNRGKRQHRSGPVIYSVFWASERPNPPKLEGGEVRPRAAGLLFSPSPNVKPVLRFPLERPRAVSNFVFSVLEGSKSAPRGLLALILEPAALMMRLEPH